MLGLRKLMADQVIRSEDETEGDEGNGLASRLSLECSYIRPLNYLRDEVEENEKIRGQRRTLLLILARSFYLAKLS